MLELPEGINIAKQLKSEIVGKKIIEAEAAHSPHGFAFFTGPPEFYKSELEGKTVDDVYANCAQVEIALGDLRLVFNDGVNTRYNTKDKPVPSKHQLFLKFDDESYLVCTVQMYAGLHLFYEGENDNFYYLVCKEKPSALSEDFDENYFMKLFETADKKLSAKAFLATEQRIPGLGNGVLQDILFNAGVNPQTKIKNLNENDMSTLYNSINTTLQKMAEKGGRDTEKDIYGNKGGYETILSSKKKDEPCIKCGGPITKKAYLGGNVYFCPICQPLKK